MKSKLMRSFAGGIIIASSVCGAVYFLDDTSEAASTPIVEKPSEDEMISMLTSAGYVVQTEEEWLEELAAVETVEATEDNTKEVIKETIIYQTMLTVSKGMTSIDVGKALERANIIESGMDFFNEVEKRGLSKGLRPGTYEIKSEMTLDEIISIIFRKK